MPFTEFKREESRTFVVAPEFAIIIALCGNGADMKHWFRVETEKGKIVIVLSENSTPDLNADKIAVADEVFIINPGGQYDEFQAAIYLTAQKLEKFIRVFGGLKIWLLNT